MKENYVECKICLEEVHKNYLSTHTIKIHHMKYKLYYDKYVKKPDEGICTICGKETRYWGGDYAKKNDKGYYYSFTCSVECRKKYWNNLNLEKYGVENNFQVEKFKQKSKETNMKKYGVEYSSQHPDFFKKRENTCYKKYGVSNPNKNPEIKSKSKITCMERYGVEHPMHVPELLEKSAQNGTGRAHAIKYTTKFGNEIRVQGSYEYYFVQICEDLRFEIENGPALYYENNGKIKKYYVDYKINQNGNLKLIEIKNSYSYEKDIIEINLKKEAAEKFCKENNMTYEIYIFNLKDEYRFNAEKEYKKIKEIFKNKKELK